MSAKSNGHVPRGTLDEVRRCCGGTTESGMPCSLHATWRVDARVEGFTHVRARFEQDGRLYLEGLRRDTGRWDEISMAQMRWLVKGEGR